ncbi:MAG: transposase [bacterium]
MTGDQSASPAHSSSLRGYRSYGRSGCWFVTKCLEPRRPLLVAGVAEKIADAFVWYANQDKLPVAAFVVMPDHWHLMFHTVGGDDVVMFMRKACHWISRQTRVALQEGGAAWQDGFHETRIRTSRQFQFVRNYIENNPVRKEWTSSAAEWQWSSAHPKYKHIVPLDWPVQFDKED